MDRELKIQIALIALMLGINMASFAQATNDCPDFIKAKAKREGKKPKPGNGHEAKLARGTNVIKFNVIQLADRKLDIPAFKQFKNNMTDFTADGEEEFKKLVQKLKEHLGDNITGEGVELVIVGSASQIPTSFDPSKPNNNIRPDGSSIQGKTTIENNKLLALARATELGKKIKAIFPEIQLAIPTLDQIKLGPTPWTESAQKRLNAAVVKKDQLAINKVYEPYQKEQYVMVSTKDYKTEFIQPESLRSCYINLVPAVFHMDADGKFNISHFTVSEAIYNKIASNITFDDVEERDAFLKEEMKIGVYHSTYAGQEHWFMLTAKEALSLRQKEDFKKVKGLYKDRIFDSKDRVILENIIVTETLKNLK